MTDNSSIDLSLTNIWRSWAAFRSGKKPSREITKFEAELETNLLRLCADIYNGSYQHGAYNHRIINEKKRRDIAVATVRDRVVHRLLYDYLVPLS
jgi:RNA-directed DNA polymerase